jgi:hypothetical protein
MNFFDTEWYPMILVGRTGNERPKIVVEAVSKVTTTVEANSKVTKTVELKSQVGP